MGESGLRFELLAAHHLSLRREFDCGEETLNHYLAERARKENEQNVARAHILYDPAERRIAGFYTLSNISVRFEHVPEEDRKRIAPYPELPATLIGRLAADSRYQGQGLGRLLVVDALARVKMQAKQSASFLVIVDAKNDDIVRFYQKFGFAELPDHLRRLYLPVSRIPPL